MRMRARGRRRDTPGSTMDGRLRSTLSNTLMSIMHARRTAPNASLSASRVVASTLWATRSCASLHRASSAGYAYRGRVIADTTDWSTPPNARGRCQRFSGTYRHCYMRDGCVTFAIGQRPVEDNVVVCFHRNEQCKANWALEGGLRDMLDTYQLEHGSGSHTFVVTSNGMHWFCNELYWLLLNHTYNEPWLAQGRPSYSSMNGAGARGERRSLRRIQTSPSCTRTSTRRTFRQRPAPSTQPRPSRSASFGAVNTNEAAVNRSGTWRYAPPSPWFGASVGRCSRHSKPVGSTAHFTRRMRRFRLENIRSTACIGCYLACPTRGPRSCSLKFCCHHRKRCHERECGRFTISTAQQITTPPSADAPSSSTTIHRSY